MRDISMTRADEVEALISAREYRGDLVEDALHEFAALLERSEALVEALRKIALWSAPNGRDAGFLEQRQFASAALRAHREGGERGE